MGVVEEERERLGVAAPAPLVCEGEREGVGGGARGGVRVPVSEAPTEGVPLGVNDALAVLEAVPLGEGVAPGVPLPLGVSERVMLAHGSATLRFRLAISASVTFTQ
jgi:hypothetical protein